MRRLTFPIALTTLLLCSFAAADSVTQLANVTDFDDLEYEWQFSTPALASIDSVVVEFSHDNVEQVQMFLENIGGASPYAFFTLVNGFGSGTGNRIGVTDGDLTDLDGLAELTFTESGGATTVRGFLADPVPTGDYLAEDWENHFGMGTPPYDPTTWRLVIRDNTFINNDQGAIGRLTVNFTPLSGGIDGDFDDDGDYDCNDVDALVADIATAANSSSFDLDGNGVVDTADLDSWLVEAGNANIGAPFLPGDGNLNGTVDVSDFNIWNGNKFTSNAAWCSGDFNADGVVDTSDFNIWNANKFTSSDAATVPEPKGMMLGLVGLMGLLLVGRHQGA